MPQARSSSLSVYEFIGASDRSLNNANTQRSMMSYLLEFKGYFWRVTGNIKMFEVVGILARD